MYICGTKVVHCLLCVCVLAQNGFLLDDYAFYNFGLLDGRVKAIDLGNRPLRTSLEKKQVTAAMHKFWNQALIIKHSLPPDSKQVKEYEELHDWFRFSRWADTRFSLLDCIDDLREKAAQNPLVNVSPGPDLFGLGSSGAHPASPERTRKRKFGEDSSNADSSPQRTRKKKFREDSSNADPAFSQRTRKRKVGEDSSGAHPASLRRNHKRRRCEDEQDFSHLEDAAWECCYCKRNAFWDLQTIRTAMTVRRAERCYNATTEGRQYSRLEWIEWFATHPFERDDMDWVVAEMKHDFVLHELRKKVQKASEMRNAWKANMFHIFGNYKLALMLIKWPLKQVEPWHISKVGGK